MPRKREKMKLLIKMAPSAMEKSSAPDMPQPLLFMIFWNSATKKPRVKKPPAAD